MNLRFAPWALVVASAIVVGCAAESQEEETSSGEEAYSEAQVSSDPTLKALQAAASNVNQYEINVKNIAVPVPNASVGASANGFSTRGLDWFQNPDVSYPDNKSWDQGTDTGKKCQWAALFRFNAIFAAPPAEAIAMRDLEGGRWTGSFWSWVDDYASTDSVGQPTASYAWSSGLWKWIGASGKDGLCRLPTKTMVARMMTACIAQANANNGDAKGCRMPAYNASVEPRGDGGVPEGGAGEGGTSEGGTSEGGARDGGSDAPYDARSDASDGGVRDASVDGG